MAAANYPITIQQGATFRLPFVIKDDGTPRNLTGYGYNYNPVISPDGAVSMS